MKLDIAIDKVLEGFELGVFVRSIEKDSDPHWAFHVMPYLQALAKLKEHRIDYPECSICRDHHPNDDRHPCE